MKRALLYLLLLTGMLFAQSCGEDEENASILDCDTSLVTTPQYKFELIQFKLGNDYYVDTVNGSGGFTTTTSQNGDTTVIRAYGASWNQLGSQYARASIQLFIKAPFPHGDSITPQEGYDALVPGDVPYLSGPDDELNRTVQFFVSGIDTGSTISSVSNSTSEGDNTASTFTITGRSPIYEDDGYYYTTLEAVFCCTIYNEESGRARSFSGNLSGRVALGRR